MMDKRPRKELIDGIRDFFRDFEEPYDHTEWEQFQRLRKSKQRKPVPLFIKLAGVAASLVLMAYASVRLLPFFDGLYETGGKASKERPYRLEGKEQQAKDTLTVDSLAPSVDDGDHLHEKPDGLVPSNRLPRVRREEKARPVSVVAPVSNTGLIPDSIAPAQAIKKPALQNIPLAADLGGHRNLPQTEPARPVRMNFHNRWPLSGNWRVLGGSRIGFNINPAFTNKGLSLGGGVSAQIPLSSRISTEIGVSYTNLRIGANMPLDMADTVSTQLIGIRHSVGMVAIPISLHYPIAKNLSATVGLTPFKVVRDQRTDILQSYRWVAGDVLSGDTAGRLVGERTTLQRADSLYKGKTYLGFIRVSGQFSPPLLKRYNAVIAPFVAIPVGRLRDDEYRWLHGGVSLRIYLR